MTVSVSLWTNRSMVFFTKQITERIATWRCGCLWCACWDLTSEQSTKEEEKTANILVACAITLMGIGPQSSQHYGNLDVISDHTVFPATRERQRYRYTAGGMKGRVDLSQLMRISCSRVLRDEQKAAAWTWTRKVSSFRSRTDHATSASWRHRDFFLLTSYFKL